MLPGRRGEGEEVHATAGRAEDQGHRSGIHEPQEHLCAVQPRSEVSELALAIFFLACP